MLKVNCLGTDDKSLIDFNAICVNRIPDDLFRKSNVRVYIRLCLTPTNHEEQRLETRTFIY